MDLKSERRHNISIYVALSLIILCLGIIFAYDKSNSMKTIKNQKTQIDRITADKSELQSNFDAALVKIESLKVESGELKTNLEEKNAEIEKAKADIRSIINKKNVSEKELAKARMMIKGLNDKIGDMENTIAMLTEENKNLGEQNKALTADKENLTKELGSTVAAKEDLEHTVDVASTLNISNISITPLDVKKNGKEKQSTSVKKVDKMMVRFDLWNRIVKPGSTNLYVLVIGPDGKPVSSGNNFSGVFKTREEGDKFFTAKFPVELETAQTKTVAFSFVPESSFMEGDYKIKIYQNGFLIGESTSSLRKGGLFS